MIEAVQLGIQRLDEVNPGWYREIDLETLDMSSAARCVLGQLYHTFSFGKEQLGISCGRDYGFALHIYDLRVNHDLAWRELREAWIEEIEARLLEDELEAASDIGVKTEDELEELEELPVA